MHWIRLQSSTVKAWAIGALGFICAGLPLSTALMAQATPPAQAGAQAAAQASMQPIIPLTYDVGQIKSLYKLGYLDPLFSEVTVSKSDVLQYQKDILELRRKISVGKTKKAGTKSGWLKRRYLLEGRIFAYRLRAMVAKGDKTSTRLAEKAKRAFMQSAYDYLRSLGSGAATAAKNAVYYNIYSSQLVFGEDFATNLQNIINISKNLNPSLQLRVRYITALQELRGGQDTAGAIRTLVRLTKAMPREVSLAIKLAIGQKLRTTKVAMPGVSYPRFLQSAIKTAKGLGRRTLEHTFNYAVAIWLSPDGFRPNWAEPPFSLKGLSRFPMYYALRERQALARHTRGDAIGAIKTYTLVRGFYKGKKQALPLDQRILAFKKAEATRTGNYALYESGLLDMLLRYRKGDALGKKNKKFALAAHSQTKKAYLRHTLFAIDESAKAGGAFTPAAAAQVKDRYIKATGMKKYGIPLTAKIADVFARKGDHRNAVVTYVNLSSKAKKAPTKIRFLQNAIRSQRVVTGWPDQQPWQGVGGLNGKETVTLSKLNNALVKLQQSKLSWDQAAHIGLLKLNQNNPEGAYSLWRSQIERAPNSTEAQKAAYLMMADYRRQNKWRNLVTIADLVRKYNIQPTLTGKTISLGQDLGDGLFNSGKQAYSERSYKTSKEYLAKFLASFTSDPRIPEALFMQANNFKQLDGFKEAIGMYRMLVRTFPRSKFFAQAAKEAFLLSITMAFEETTMQIGKLYLQALPNDPFNQQIKPWLAKIYMGRQLYSEASDLLVKDLKNPAISAPKKAEVARKLMDLEEAHGSLGKAFYGALQIKKYAGKNHSLIAAALRFEGRHASGGDQYAKLVALEKAASGLELAQPGVATALAYLRFRLAEFNGAKAQAAPDNATLQNPIKAITGLYQNFLDTRTYFDRVCEIGATPYCAPAMYRLAKLAINQIGTIESVTQPSSLSEEAAAPFENKKRDIIGYLQDTAIWADKKALEMVKNGQTDPLWIQQIIWTNSQDWNFEQVTGTGGLGYSQWEVREAR